MLGYNFTFMCKLEPILDEDGKVAQYYPQNLYKNDKNLPLHQYGKESFCKFSPKLKPIKGVYLWVVNNEVIYIGETDNLEKRFRQGYGNVSPRNCFKGGQSTNCKMNKVALQLFLQGKEIEIYFYETEEYKNVERELLQRINTKYNQKNNRSAMKRS